MFVQLKKDHFGQKAGARIDVDEPVANALLAQGIAEAVTGDPLAPVVAKSMESLLTTLTRGLNDAMETTLKQFADAQTRTRRNAVPLIFGAGGNGDPKKTFGHFLLAVRRGDARVLEEMGSRWADWENVGQKTAMTTQTGTQGGYTVPTEFLPNLLMLSAENSVVESRATRIPMTTPSIEVPSLDVTTAPSSAGDTAFFGGVTASWSQEAAQLTEKEPTFKQLRLTAHELSGYTLASNALLNDNAVGLEALLLQIFGSALGWYKDYAFLRGNGAGKPLGVLNATALISVTRSGASAVALADVAGMLGRMLPGWNPRNTVWAIHPTVLVKLLTMAATAAGSPNIFLSSAQETPRMQLFGIPVVVTEKLPSLNTLGDILLLNLQHYLVGDRQMVEIAFSEHYRFINNQGAWRFVARVDGQPWMRDKVTLADTTSTLSPFVGLAPG
jgi:HK97 family phage major capsid protein